jgi:hypothetical protein
MAQVIGVDGHGLRPAEADEDEGQRPEGIDVGERIEREPSVQPRGGIAETVGDDAVSELVDGDGEEERRDLEEKAKDEPGGVAEEVGHPPPVGTRSSGSLSPGMGSPGARYRSSSHAPRSMRRHVSEQKGRWGLPVHTIRVAQCGQRGERAGAVPAEFTHASYRRRAGAVNRGGRIDFIGLAPVLGRILGFTLMTLSLRIFSAAFYSLGHGTNDAQKTMGIIAVLLFSAGHLLLFSAGHLGLEFYVPFWVVLAAHPRGGAS